MNEINSMAMDNVNVIIYTDYNLKYAKETCM